MSSSYTGATPTGAVRFYDGQTLLATVPLSSGYFGGSGQASFTTTALGLGSHPLTAVYDGDGTFAGGPSQLDTVTVQKAATSVYGGASPSWVAAGQPVTLSANVSSTYTGAAPTGLVRFYEGGVLLAAVPLTLLYGNVQASWTTTLGVGTHTLTVEYDGDDVFLGSTFSGIVVTVE